jgi:AraC-like DNA-binding protein
MAKRSAAALILLAETLRRVGHGVEPVLRRFGFASAQLDPSSVVDQALELRINEAIADALDDPLAGLKAAMQLGVGTYGPFSLLLLTSDDLLGCLQTAIRFQRVSFPFSRAVLQPGRARTAFVLQPPALAGRAFRFRVDLEAAASWKLATDINRAARVDVAPVEMQRPYPRPDDAAAYEKAFGCPVSWGGRSVRMLWPNAGLGSRFATADPGAHAVMRAQCERMILALDAHEEDLAARVRAHVAAHLAAAPSAAATARALGHSERHPRRRLDAAGTSYRAELDAVRASQARDWLKDARTTVEEVAARLGYSDAAVFIRAFRRWTGQSPAAWRRQALRAGR